MFLDNFQYKEELPLFVFLILQEILSGRMNEWGSIKLQFEVFFFFFFQNDSSSLWQKGFRHYVTYIFCWVELL